MPPSRKRLIIAALLLAAAGAGGFAYFKYRKISDYVLEQVSGQAAKKLGREVKFKSAAFSPLKGIVIREACVSRLPDFSRGNFFCASKVVIRPKLGALLRNQVYFSSVSFERPVIKVRERGGRWDFADLLALLPDTDKGLYLTWNANTVQLRGAAVEADMETSGLSLTLEDLDLSLEHFSSYGGHYGLEGKGRLKTVHSGKLVSAEVEFSNDANFEYSGLSSASGKFRAEALSYGAATLESFEARWNLFNMLKPLAEKNYDLSVRAEGLLIPAQEGSARARVAEGLQLFSRAMGRPVPEVDDVKLNSLKAAFALDNSVIALKGVELRSDFISLDAALTIFGPPRKADAELKAEIGGSKFSLSATGPMDKPRIKPLLAATLDAKFRTALADIENYFLKIFPVTGATP